MGSRNNWDRSTRATRQAVAKYEVAGLLFPNVNAAYSFAQSKGFAGCKTVILERLNRGVQTIEELCAPVSKAGHSELRKAEHKRRHDEMAAVIAALDARKAAMPKDEEE